MGGNLSCVSCIERERDEALQPLYSARSYDGTHKEHNEGGTASVVAESPESEIEAAVNNGAEHDKQRNELQDQINAIVKARSTPRKQDPSAFCMESALQEQINAIVHGHAQSLRQQREMASPCSEWASPSPAKSMSHMDIAHFANLAVSNAKERHTPAKSPPVPEDGLWGYEDNLAPCQLNFANYDEAVESQKAAPPTILVEPTAAPSREDQHSEKCIDAPKVESAPFDVSDIPSPTRNRAKKQQALLAAMTDTEDVQQSVVENNAGETLQKETVSAAEPNVPEQEEADRAKGIEEEARRLREADEMAEMDRMCVDTFLESVKRCTWQSRVRTPIKGSNLYTKHIRPCRPAGTSVDVKDSSFRSLGWFLQFLESEGLLRLQPGLTDPVVSEINFEACRQYKYIPGSHLAAMAPHNEGCCCRRCTNAVLPMTQYQ